MRIISRRSFPKRFMTPVFTPIVQEAEQGLSSYPLSMKIALKFGLYPVLERNVPH
jgi:hypothetical protein